MRSPFYWLLGLCLALMLTVVPFIYYRWEYTHSKRLRVVTEDKVYRSGQMTASGFAEAVERYQIHTIINLQDEFPDPEIALGYFTRKTIKESELCRQLGVRYIFLGPDLISRRKIPQERPPAIDKFLALMDDPAKRVALGAAGHKEVLENCRWSEVAFRVKDEIERFMGAKDLAMQPVLEKN